MKKFIHTEKAPAAIGTYNQAILTGNLLFTSGQIAINPLTGELVDGDAKPQTEMIFKNIMAILNKANLDKKHIVKLNVFLINLKDFEKVNQVFESFFNDNSYPARTTIEVSRLPMDALVEIDCVACLDV